MKNNDATEAALIAAFIEKHGLTRSVDFAANHPAVMTLREGGYEVLPSRWAETPWYVDDTPTTTEGLWRQANRERKRRNLTPLRRAPENKKRTGKDR